MDHPEVDNRTPFVADVLHMDDEHGRAICCTVVKATYDVGPELRLAEQQEALCPAGEPWDDEAPSSYRYEPETAFVKLATDVVLVGHARAPTAGATHVDTGFKVGNLQKVVRVFGDRHWVKQGGQIVTTAPRPIDRIPLRYELAFGGWDKADRVEENWTCEPRNPVGRGFGKPLRFVKEGMVPLPNLEDPRAPLRHYGDTPAPAGYGFVSPDWQPRASFAGTYDERWEKQRKPLLPADFDRRYFSAASPGLVAPGYLRGDEEVMVVNAAPEPRVAFRLPAVAPPTCRLHLRGHRREELQTNLDTVIVDTDRLKVLLLWRAHVTLRNGPFDLTAVAVSCEQAPPHGSGP